MTKHQQQQAAIAGFVPAAFESLQEPLKFPAGEVFSDIHGFAAL
jgi:hypothetical protein